MSVNYAAFYNACVKVMGEMTFHLLCEWHIKRACGRNLSKINDLKKRETVLSKLCLLAEQTYEDNLKKKNAKR